MALLDGMGYDALVKLIISFSVSVIQFNSIQLIYFIFPQYNTNFLFSQFVIDNNSQFRNTILILGLALSDWLESKIRIKLLVSA